MMYGAETSGISSPCWTSSAQWPPRRSRHKGAGKDKLISLWLHDCASNRTDPSFLAHEMPIATYAKACWEKWLPDELFVKADNDTVKSLGQAKHAWRAAKGPFAATMLSARRIGWKFLSAFTATNDQGILINMKVDSPQFVKDEVTNSVRRSIAREIDAAYPMLKSKGNGPVMSGKQEAQLEPHSMEERLCPLLAVSGLQRAMASGATLKGWSGRVG